MSLSRDACLERLEVRVKPRIERSTFGSITIGGDSFNHDILIRLDGTIRKRKKKLSKKKYGTSHKISREEIEHAFEEGADLFVIGTGQYDRVRLSRKAKMFLEQEKCEVLLAPTQEAIDLWNTSGERTIALFHVTC
jgi:hypothetical protein